MGNWLKKLRAPSNSHSPDSYLPPPPNASPWLRLSQYTVAGKPSWQTCKMIIFCTAPWLCHSSKAIQVICKQQLSLWTPAMLHYLLFIDKEALSPKKGICQGHRNKWQSWEGIHSISSSVVIYFPIATDSSPRKRKVLVAHFPGGLLSLCPLVSLLPYYNSLLNSNFQSQMVTIRRAGETARFSLYTLSLSHFLGSHAQLNRGSGQSKIQELCFLSYWA